MTIDFNKPVEADLYNNDVLTTIRDNIKAAVTASFIGGSNVPDRAIRYNEAVTPARWEKYVLSTTTWVPIDETFASGTIMIFGSATAPTGWTRKADWDDNSMLVFSATGSIDSGGFANPKDGHTHTGPSHAHSMQSHTHTGPSHSHTGPSHSHGDGTLSASFSITSGGSVLKLWREGGTTYSATGYTNVPIAGVTNIADTDTRTGTDVTGSTDTSGTGSTGTSGTGNTGAASVSLTANGGTAATGQNTTPLYQEVIAATKD